MNGRFEGQVHRLPLQIYYEDTDFSGVVYHANYLKFAERGRSDFLRGAGVNHSDLLALQPALAFVVTQMQIRFFAPARIDDQLVVDTCFTEARGPRLAAAQVVRRDDTILWQADVHAACVDLDGRPRRMPADIVEKMAPFLAAAPPEGFVEG